MRQVSGAVADDQDASDCEGQSENPKDIEMGEVSTVEREADDEVHPAVLGKSPLMHNSIIKREDTVKRKPTKPRSSHHL